MKEYIYLNICNLIIMLIFNIPFLKVELGYFVCICILSMLISAYILYKGYKSQIKTDIVKYIPIIISLMLLSIFSLTLSSLENATGATVLGCCTGSSTMIYLSKKKSNVTQHKG